MTNDRREILIIGVPDSATKAALMVRINKGYLKRQYLEQGDGVAVASSAEQLHEEARDLIRRQYTLLFYAFLGGQVDLQLHPSRKRENTDLSLGQARSYLDQELR